MAIPNIQQRSSEILAENLNERDRAALLAELQSALDGRIRDIVLTNRLSGLFQQASWRQRSQITRAWLAWGAGLSIALVAVDYLISPALLGPSLLMRAVFLPVVYGALL